MTTTEATPGRRTCSATRMEIGHRRLSSHGNRRIPNPRDVIIFDASASDDPDGNIVSYEWDWNNDGGYDESHLVPRAGHSFRRSGRYRVGLRVTDDEGAIDAAARTVTVFR